MLEVTQVKIAGVLAAYTERVVLQAHPQSSTVAHLVPTKVASAAVEQGAAVQLVAHLLAGRHGAIP